MRHFLVASAAIAVTAPASAHAAIYVQYDVFARGSVKTYSNYSPIPTVQEVGATFSGPVYVLGLEIGQSLRFEQGPNSNAGVKYGTITRTADDALGNATFVGTDFLFSQQQLLSPLGSGIRETVMRAERFTVRQIVPAPVPEPTTWAMMVLGFGAAGYALRRRTLRFRLA